jgi:hypothetical protein
MRIKPLIGASVVYISYAPPLLCTKTLPSMSPTAPMSTGIRVVETAICVTLWAISDANVVGSWSTSR